MPVASRIPMKAATSQKIPAPPRPVRKKGMRSYASPSTAIGTNSRKAMPVPARKPIQDLGLARLIDCSFASLHLPPPTRQAEPPAMGRAVSAPLRQPCSAAAIVLSAGGARATGVAGFQTGTQESAHPVRLCQRAPAMSLMQAIIDDSL